MQVTEQFVLPPMPVAAKITQIYPWENTELGVLCQRIFAIAAQSGFTGTFDDFKTSFGAYLEQNKIITIEDFEKYIGQYEVIPLPFVDQILQTGKKLLTDNIVVSAIPYATTTNLAGGYTAIIG